MIRFTMHAFRGIAILSLIYYIIVYVISGRKTSFSSFWLATWMVSTSLSLMFTYALQKDINTLLRTSKIISILFWIGIVFFLIVEGFLIFFGNNVAKPDADYAIVLGAQVRGTTPSKTLEMRIQTAAYYLNENPNTIVICSGGQGTGEDISEAYAIQQGLIRLGIDEERISLEERSTNTVENLTYSMEFLENTSQNVVIITSNFHCFLAVKLAKKLGLQNISSLGASELMVTTPQYYVREFFAIAKDFFVGNLSFR